MTKPRMSLSWTFPLNLVPAPGRPGQLVPDHFSATIELDEMTVALSWEVVEDTVVVRRVVATGDVVRSGLRLEDWTAKAVDSAASFVRDRVRHSPASALEPAVDVPIVEGRVWNGLTDEHLREVAEVFNEAESEPIRAVANRFQISHSTARGRVTTARKRGLLV